MIDEIDKHILKCVKEKPGIQVSQVSRALRSLRGDGAIRRRINQLHRMGLLDLDRRSARHFVFCRISARGNHALQEHEPEEGRS